MATLLLSCAENKSAQLLYDAKADVGEGALWDIENQRLLWIDIVGETLYIYYPHTQNMHAYKLPRQVATVVPIQADTLLVALDNGFYTFSISHSSLQELLLPEINIEDLRFNDGKCAPDGTLWIGTMHQQVNQPIAKLYKLSTVGVLEEMEDGITVSNGIAWSPDGATMYYTDSPTYTIVAYNYDARSASISNKRIAIRTPKAWGTPDGNTIDKDGMLWIAHWGGGIVSKWNPTTGELLDSIKVPAPHVTSVALGGKDLKTLFITSSKKWMTDEEKAQYPLAGGLFSIRVETPGIPCNYYK